MVVEVAIPNIKDESYGTSDLEDDIEDHFNIDLDDDFDPKSNKDA
jgi:hypothetical protein